jgi:hypothetical protein
VGKEFSKGFYADFALADICMTILEGATYIHRIICMNELESFNASNWFAIFAPKKTPVETINKLNLAIQKTLLMPKVKKQYIDSGNQPIPGSAIELDQLVKTETANYKALLSNAKISLD